MVVVVGRVVSGVDNWWVHGWLVVLVGRVARVVL